MRGLLRACVLVVVVFRAIRRGSARIAVALTRGASRPDHAFGRHVIRTPHVSERRFR
jgi:hypothetical protein